VAVTRLNGNVAENAEFKIPEVTAVVRGSAGSPVGPIIEGGLVSVDIRTRELRVLRNLATIVIVVVEIVATRQAGVASAIPVAKVIITLAGPGSITNVTDTGRTVVPLLELIAVNALSTAKIGGDTAVDRLATVTTIVEAVIAGQVALTGKRLADTDGTTKLGPNVATINAIAVGDAWVRLVVPGKSALTVGVEPREDGVGELGRRTDLSVNRAHVTPSLATVTRIVVAIVPILFALIQAVAGPAVLVGEVVDGAPKREVTIELESLGSPKIRGRNSVDSRVVRTIAVLINEGLKVDVLGPILTVSFFSDTTSTEIDVESSSVGGITEPSAVV